MSRKELITPEGYRLDGRFAETPREIQLSLGVSRYVDGSASFKMGATEVLAEVIGPFDAIKKERQGKIKVDTTIAAFAMPFRLGTHTFGRKITDISMVVQNMCTSIIRRGKYDQSEIIINLVVLRNEGGLAAACLNAAFLALINANIYLKESVCAMSVGLLGRQVLNDISYEEGSAIDEMIVAIGMSTGEIHALMHSSRCSIEEQLQLLTYAKTSMGATSHFLKKGIHRHMNRLLEAQKQIKEYA